MISHTCTSCGKRVRIPEADAWPQSCPHCHTAPFNGIVAGQLRIAEAINLDGGKVVHFPASTMGQPKSA